MAKLPARGLQRHLVNDSDPVSATTLQFDTQYTIYEKILQLTGGGGGVTTVVADITARDAIGSPYAGQRVHVLDASDDSTVVSGWAEYLYVSSAWVKTSEEESLDLGSGVPGSGDLTEDTSSILTITDGTGAVLGTGTTIEVQQASTTTDGYLSSTDWNTFDGKQDALGYTPENIANKGVASGYVPLDGSSKIANTYLPALAITETYVVANETEQLALTVQEGDVAVRTDENKSYIALNSDNVDMGDWQELLTPTDSVTSVNGETGVVSISVDDLDNTTITSISDNEILQYSSGSWINRTFAEAGLISISGTPVDNRIAIWTNANTLEGDAGLTYDGTTFNTTGNIQTAGGWIQINKVGDSASAGFYLSTDAGYEGQINWRTGSLMRWKLHKDAVAESGSNAGSDMALSSYDDSGTLIGEVFDITRATRVVDFKVSPTVNGTPLDSADDDWSDDTSYLTAKYGHIVIPELTGDNFGGKITLEGSSTPSAQDDVVLDDFNSSFRVAVGGTVCGRQLAGTTTRYRVQGHTTGNANIAYNEWTQSDGTRTGYVGESLGTGQNIYLNADLGNIIINSVSGSIGLQHAGSQKLITASDGVDVTGAVDATDGFVDGDWKMYHNTTDDSLDFVYSG